jgi:hypothetical protein
MYDINFFSVYKKKKNKNSALKIFIAVFLLLFVLGNALLIGGGLMLFSRLEASIAEKDAYLKSKEVQDKIIEAERIKQEAALSNEYLSLLQSATAKLQKTNTLNTALLDQIRAMTPVGTQFTSSEYKGTVINLHCLSWTLTDPMDMYHAFLANPLFAKVTLSSVSIREDGQIGFGIICQLLGGGDK